MKDRPKPIGRLTDLPEHVMSWLRQHGVATCDQAYALVLQLLEAEPDRALPVGLTSDDLSLLRERLEQGLPVAIRTRLEEAQHVRWTDQRPLGVLLPDTPGRNKGNDEQASAERPRVPARRKGPSSVPRGGKPR